MVPCEKQTLLGSMATLKISELMSTLWDSKVVSISRLVSRAAPCKGVNPRVCKMGTVDCQGQLSYQAHAVSDMPVQCIMHTAAHRAVVSNHCAVVHNDNKEM